MAALCLFSTVKSFSDTVSQMQLLSVDCRNVDSRHKLKCRDWQLQCQSTTARLYRLSGPCKPGRFGLRLLLPRSPEMTLKLDQHNFTPLPFQPVTFNASSFFDWQHSRSCAEDGVVICRPAVQHRLTETWLKMLCYGSESQRGKGNHIVTCKRGDTGATFFLYNTYNLSL